MFYGYCLVFVRIVNVFLTKPTNSSIPNCQKSVACWEAGSNLYRAVPDDRRRPLVIGVVGVVRVQVELAIRVIPAVDVRNVRPVGKALLTIIIHQIQTHPNLVFYTKREVSSQKHGVLDRLLAHFSYS